jgi:hypothetical protein
VLCVQLAVMAEFRQEWSAAITQYQAAYAHCREVRRPPRCRCRASVRRAPPGCPAWEGWQPCVLLEQHAALQR